MKTSRTLIYSCAIRSLQASTLTSAKQAPSKVTKAVSWQKGGYIVHIKTSRTLIYSCAIHSLIRRYKHTTASERFVVKRLTSPEEVRDVMCERVAAGGWRPGALDHEAFFAADETGFFAGELDGKTISCMSVVKHAKNFAFLGNYIVDEPYRGSGYGLKTWKGAMSSIDDDYNVGGDAVIEKVPIYRRIGLEPKWSEQRFDLVALQAASAFSGSQLSQQIKIEPVSKIIFTALIKYDTSLHAFPRNSFLEKWVFAPNCHASVAIDKQERIVGYSVIRSTLREEDGWRIGPLFADDALIARSLYQDVCTKVAMKDPKAVIAVDVPYGDFFNPDTLKIVNELSGKPSFKCMRIYKKGVPSWMLLQKVFGITSIEIG